jgi:Peptidase family M1 domain
MRTAQRIIQRVLNALAILVAAAIATLVLVAYVGASTHDLTLLKPIAAHLSTLFDGQRTEALKLDTAVYPNRRRLDGHVRLTLRSLRGPRQRFYFLLNSGLKIQAARVLGSHVPPSVYQLWMVAVVDVGRPISENSTIDVELDYGGSPTTSDVGIGSGFLDSQGILLGVDQFWYPNDIQSFFQADVSVTLPARFTLVHNGHEIERMQRGDRQRIRWQSERPIAGMALVAGPYRRTTATIDGQLAQLYLADDVTLDADQVLHEIADANGMLTRRFGASGFPRITAFVTRRLRRAFNDGAGTLGLSIRYFRRGDYGFRAIAHEVAHNWWGGTVAAHWLSSGTGGEWIVEGLAEFSSLLATEERWGRDALTRALTEEFFDPARQTAVASMTVLDNAWGEAGARDTIYRKGAYVAMMLRNAVGDDQMRGALRQFIERFRYKHATDRDLEATIRKSSGKDLGSFFADWLRSDKLADLTLEPSGKEQVDVRNRGRAMVPGSVALWAFEGGPAPSEQHTVKVGETVALPSGTELSVIDPQLAWADMVRFNNRSPRHPEPEFVAISSRKDLLVTSGEPHPWAATTIVHRTGGGTSAHAWDFERGLTQPPAWSPDGGRILASASETTGAWPAIIALNAVDGSRATIGYGASPAFGRNGRVFAAHGDHLLRFDPTGSRVMARHRGYHVESPVPSPSGSWIAYVAARGNEIDLRVCDEDGGKDRSLLTWDRDRFLARWAPDGSRLYALMGGNWDWQVWEIPLDQSSIRVLVREAVDIRDFAVSPDGAKLALAAVSSVHGPSQPHRLYVVDLADGTARELDSVTGDVWQVVWQTSDTLLAVVSANSTPLVIPEKRTLQRVHVSDGSSETINWETHR